MATQFKLTPEEEQSIKDRRALISGASGAGLGALKLGAAAADIGTLPIRAGMGAANTLLRIPNAFGANIPYIPEPAFGGSSASMTPYMDKLRAAYPEMLGSSVSTLPSTVPAPTRIPSRVPSTRMGAMPDDFAESGGFGATRQDEVAPFTAEDIRGNRVPVSGTGAFMNSRGEVTNLDTRGSVVPAAPERNFSSLANAVGAMMNQRRAAATEARGLATNKMLMEYALKAPGAQESAGKAQIHAATLELAKRAADSGATPAEVSAILANRAPPTETWTAPFGVQPMTQEAGKPPVYNVLSSRGALKAVSPTTIPQKITAANVDAALAGSMKGKSRAEVIQMYKNRGYDITGVQ